MKILKNIYIYSGGVVSSGQVTFWKGIWGSQTGSQKGSTNHLFRILKILHVVLVLQNNKKKTRTLVCSERFGSRVVWQTVSVTSSQNVKLVISCFKSGPLLSHFGPKNHVVLPYSVIVIIDSQSMLSTLLA